MLKSNYLKLLAITSGLALAATVEAQTTVIGSFQGSSDGNNGAFWQDAADGYASLASDSPYATFPAAAVPNYAYSLELNPEGGTGYKPQIQVSLTAAQIAAFNNDSYITFTFSVPTATNGVNITGGYYQLVNLYIQEGAGGNYGGYQNLISGSGWAGLTQFEPNTPGDTASTANNQSGEANFYFGPSEESEYSEVVTINYSSFLKTNPVLEGDTTNGLVLGFQFNQSVGSPTYINNIVLSPGPFGSVAPVEPTGTYVVDNFSSGGVSPQNPTNDDYYSSAENYAQGDITNVWWNWFGSQFSNVVWVAGVSPSYAPSQGSMAIQLDWNGAANEQFEMWDQSPTNNYYALNLSALVYTNFQCDIMFAPGSATNLSGNFGLVQFGDRTPAYGEDYFGGGNTGISVASTNAGVWQHVSIPLNASADTNLLDIQGLLIHTYDQAGQLNGPSTLYVDNIEFTGPTTAPAPIPPPDMTIQPAVPGLRMFVGSSATYVREGVITTQGSGESESWAGSGVHYPVNYSFQLLSYPAAGVGVTELAILPEASFNTTANYQTTIYNNPFLDSQDSNGLYLTIAPYNGSGAVTATVQWKVGLPSPTAALTNVLDLTNSTAIGTWTLTMHSATSGTVTAPGGQSGNFTIADPNVSSDFANPAVAVIAEDPNSTAGYGLYEDYGTISITGTGSGTQTENFSDETSEFNGTTSPGGYFQNTFSVDPGNLVIVRNGLDKYWFSWTQDLLGNYVLVTATSILTPLSQWISPLYYSEYYLPDESAPWGVGVRYAPNYWQLLPADDVPTADGGQQQDAPSIDDPPASHAYFMLTTNTANIYP